MWSMLLSLLAVPASAAYTEYSGMTCWNGHGAIEIDTDDTATSGHTVESCEQICEEDGTCECVAFRPSDGKCWRRKACDPSHFGPDGNYNTYVQTSPAPPTPPSPPPAGRDCLCIFDIDRTLTGRQGDTSTCPANSLQAGVRDCAYDNDNDLTLSEVGQALSGTFCESCHLGVISAGDGSVGCGSDERSILHNNLAAADASLPDDWAAPGCDGTTPLVTNCPDGHKQSAVPGIIRWYRENLGASIADADVHFFDDRSDNVEAFRSTQYNARQISCASRDNARGGVIGYCGAQRSEIVATSGVTTCNGLALVV